MKTLEPNRLEAGTVIKKSNRLGWSGKIFPSKRIWFVAELGAPQT
jgi:hypothetical protein